jgi:hypothetical protein
LFALRSDQRGSGYDRRIILGTDEAALDEQLAIAIDADERPGAGDLGGIVTYRTTFERPQRGLDLA